MSALQKIFLLSLLATLLVAKNPDVYSALGNVVYDNVQKIEKLKSISEYKYFSNKIDTYVLKVQNLKRIGFAIEAGDKSVDKLKYLQKLRDLSKVNDFFLRTIKKNFELSMKNENNLLFFQTINSGLMDVQKHKTEIKAYYELHSNEVNETGVIQNFMNADIIKKQTEAIKRKTPTKQQLQKAKIKRIREKDKIKQKAIKKSLEDEAIRKKIKIREKQERELTD